MAYTPTTWANGDTITAEKLNKLEQGVANSGGTATIWLSATGYNSGTHIFGYLVYAYLDNGAWKLCNDENGYSEILGWTTPNDRVLVKPLPSDDNVGLFLIDTTSDDRTITGDISTNPATLYFSYGSVFHNGNNAYRIMGNGSYQFIAY